MRGAILVFLLASLAEASVTSDLVRSLWTGGKSHAYVGETLEDLEIAPADRGEVVEALLPGLEHESGPIRDLVLEHLQEVAKPADSPMLLSRMDNATARPYLARLLTRILPSKEASAFYVAVQAGGKWGDVPTRRGVAQELTEVPAHRLTKEMRRQIEHGLSDPDLEVRAQSALAGNTTLERNDPVALDAVTVEVLQNSNLQEEIAQKLWLALQQRKVDGIRVGPRLETIVELIEAYPHFWNRDHLQRDYLSSAFNARSLVWDPVNRQRMEDKLVALLAKGNSAQRPWAGQALGFIGVLDPKNRDAIRELPHTERALGHDPAWDALQSLRLPRYISIPDESANSALKTALDKLPKDDSPPGSKRQRELKALIAQLDNPHKAIWKNVEQRILERFEGPDAPLDLTPDILSRLERLDRSGSVPFAAYLLVRANQPNKLKQFAHTSLRPEERVWIARALSEEMALPDDQQPASDLKGAYVETAEREMEKMPGSASFLAAEALLDHADRYELSPALRQAARERIADALGGRDITSEERLRGARLLSRKQVPLNAREAISLLRAKARPENADPAIQHHLDLATAWLAMQGTVEPSPLGKRSPKENDHAELMELVVDRSLPAEIRYSALSALRRMPDGPTLAEPLMKLLSQSNLPPELRDPAAEMLRDEERLAKEEKAAQAFGPRAQRALKSTCRKVAQAAAWPYGHWKRALVSVPLTVWYLNGRAVRNQARSLERPIPDVLYLSLDAIAAEPEHRRTAMLAAARELRKDLLDEKGNFSLKEYWRWLNRSRMDLGGEVSDIVRDHGLAGNTFESAEAFSKHFGSWTVNRELELDKLSADIIEAKLHRALVAGAGGEMVLADLIYEAEGTATYVETDSPRGRGRR